MGTRNLTCVVLDNQIKVAQYGQWVGYPEGQGATILEFLKVCDLENFKERVSKLREITAEELSERWVECGNNGKEEWVTLSVSHEMKEKYPEFHRDLGAEILQYIADGKVSAVNLATDFAAKSLFCEWCYVVDLDRNVLEIYKGFVKEPHKGQRFSDLPREKEDEKYYPVAIEREFPFQDLPDTVEEFVALFHDKEK